MFYFTTLIRISIRINFVRKGVCIESLSEPFYPNADDIRHLAKPGDKKILT